MSYSVWLDDEKYGWMKVAGSTSINSARHYAMQYREDGDVLLKKGRATIESYSAYNEKAPDNV